uniref:Uncharacterized protein n=1 Tax=Anopheles epiroticus TaxID=199890 RepID=A0A182PTA5_9DIPT
MQQSIGYAQNAKNLHWPNFEKAFDDTTEEGKYSNLENLNRLRQALYGSALKVVQLLLMDDDNVPTVMERLNKDSDDPDLVYLELLNNLRKIRKE